MQVRAAEEGEYSEVLAMTHEAFRNETGGRSSGEFERKIVEATIASDTNFRNEDLRIVKTEGRIVSMMLIIRRQVRFGKSTVNNAIISPVATRVGYEKRGYCSAVMRNAIDHMKRQEFDLTTLWGHPWLYTHYGYAPAMVSPSVAIKPERCCSTEFKDKLIVQPYEKTQAKAVTDIYHQNTSNQILAEIRTPEPFEWKIRSPNVEFCTVIGEEGSVIGYFATSRTAEAGKNLLEVGVVNAEACKIIFNKALEYAKEKKLTEIVCPAIPQHPFAQFAYWQNAELRVTMASGAGFARILNMTGLFMKIRNELGNRLNRSEFYNRTLSMTLKTGEETIGLWIDNGEIAVCIGDEKTDYTVEVPLTSLNSLVTGYRSICELVEKKEVVIITSRTKDRDCIRLVDVLFPKGTPYGSILPLFWE